MSEFQNKPEIVIFAGPNGSGKSTFAQLLKPSMDYINADEIKKYLKCSDLEAAQFETVTKGKGKGVFYTLLLYFNSRFYD